MPNTSINTSIYTAMGTLMVLLITTLGGYIYNSSNSIIALQGNIGYLSKQVEKITMILESQNSYKSKFLLLEQKVNNAEKNINNFMSYGDRFSRKDWEIERKRLLEVIDDRLKK